MRRERTDTRPDGAEDGPGPDPLRAFVEAYLADLDAGRRQPLAGYLQHFPRAHALFAEAVLQGQLDDPDLALGSAEPAAGPAPGTGRTIGPYRVLEEIGRGGQAVVYLAQDTRLPRRVALKVLASRDLFASTETFLRFQVEAETTSRLDHPGIGQVYETGEDQGLPYIAMRYVEGRSLAEWIAAARAAHPDEAFRLDLPEDPSTDTSARSARTRGLAATPERRQVFHALLLIERAARALHVAHEAGIIHRDIKPGNLMVAADGTPVILDFGLARDESSDRPALTRTGDQFGTPAYMSPEQIRADGASLDRRTDVYSLGVSLYETLTGQRPFEAPTQEALYRRILTGNPPDPCRLRRSLPKEVKVVIETAIDVDRQRRYQTALELAEDLRRIQNREPIHAEPAGLGLRARRWVQRNPIVSTFLTLLTLALLSTGLMYREAQANYDDFSRLSDARVLERIRYEADRELWPAWPDKIPDLERWLGEVDALTRRLPEHRAELARIRARALPYTQTMRNQDRQRHPLAAELDLLQEARARLADAPPAAHDAATERRLAALDRQIENLDAEVGARRSWVFERHTDQVLHDALAELVQDLERFTAERGTIAAVEDRLSWARSIERRSIDEHRAAWRSASDAIRASDAYGPLELAPQIGLVPLGPDPDSGLQEFAHLGSGTVPSRDPATRRLSIADDTSVVFVLLPGGALRMGAQDDPSQPSFDPLLRTNERHLEELRLEPFFLAKHELTQAQWRALSGGDNPSYYPAGTRQHGDLITLRNPVENVSWTMCDDLLARHGLVLPTEAQWEYAIRAGRYTVWYSGDRRMELEGSANLYDETARAAGFLGDAPESFSDQHVVHAPVGCFLPNRFGLCDLAGNVWEWCRDRFGLRADHPHRPSDGELLVAPSDAAADADGQLFVGRGGCFGFNADHARSAARAFQSKGTRNSYWGVRAARRILPARVE